MHYRSLPRIANTSRRGFSLLELLVVIVIIGVVAGIGILTVGRRHYTDSREAVARRNAQQFVSLAITAQAGGADPMRGDVKATLEALQQGITFTEGAYANQTLRFSGVTEKDLIRAAYYLEIQNGMLTYLASKPTNQAN
jgi:prepilin-type N-terminal cleavage/methylation domain-containing protein